MFASAEVETFWAYTERSLDGLVEILRGLDEDELNWRPPAPNTNSLFVLVVHALGNAEENLLATLGGQAGARSREDEFAAVGVSAALIEERWSDLRERIPVALSAVEPPELERPRPHPRRGTITGREVLLVVARHAAEHLGQAELTRDLMKESRRG